MQRYFGSRPADLKAVIGPGIRSCCYQVGPEVRDAFESQFSYASGLFRHTKETDEIHEKYPLLFLTSRAPGHSELPQQIFLDLAEANRRQLLDAGVLKKNISEIALCTACRTDLLFSHRAEAWNHRENDGSSRNSETTLRTKPAPAEVFREIGIKRRRRGVCHV